MGIIIGFHATLIVMALTLLGIAILIHIGPALVIISIVGGAIALCTLVPNGWMLVVACVALLAGAFVIMAIAEFIISRIGKAGYAAVLLGLLGTLPIIGELLK